MKLTKKQKIILSKTIKYSTIGLFLTLILVSFITFIISTINQ